MEESSRAALIRALRVAQHQRERVQRDLAELAAEDRALQQTIGGISQLIKPGDTSGHTPHSMTGVPVVAFRQVGVAVRQAQSALRQIELDRLRQDPAFSNVVEALREVEQALHLLGVPVGASTQGAQGEISTPQVRGSWRAVGPADSVAVDASAFVPISRPANSSSSTARVAELLSKSDRPMSNAELYEEFRRRGWIEDEWSSPEAAVSQAARRAHHMGLIARDGKRWTSLHREAHEQMVRHGLATGSGQSQQEITVAEAAARGRRVHLE